MTQISRQSEDVHLIAGFVEFCSCSLSQTRCSSCTNNNNNTNSFSMSCSARAPHMHTVPGCYCQSRANILRYNTASAMIYCESLMFCAGLCARTPDRWRGWPGSGFPRRARSRFARHTACGARI